MFGFVRKAELQAKLNGVIYQNYANSKENAALHEKINYLEVSNEVNFGKIANLKAEVNVLRKLYLKKSTKRRRRVRTC